VQAKNGIKRAFLLSTVSLVAACGGGGGGTDNTTQLPAQYSISGAVTGLTATGLVLQDGNGNAVTLSQGATNFAFKSGATYLPSGQTYAVTVAAQPSGLTCSVSNGAGTVSANVTVIQVSCASGSQGVAALSESTLQWGIQTPISATLKNPNGQVVTGALTCVSNDTTALDVANDCSTAKAKRIGNYQVTVSGGGVSANALVRQIPQRQALLASGMSESAFSVLQSDGTPLFWGSNLGAQLAQFILNTDSSVSFNGSFNSSLPLIGQMNTTQNISGISQVSLGNQNSSDFLLTETGEVFSWIKGKNSGRPSSTVLPSKVVNTSNTGYLNHIAQIQAGDLNASALRDDGYVYSWGWSYTAGQGSAVTNTDYPNFVKLNDGSPLTDVVQISAGRNFTLALTGAGEVYVWGENDIVKLKNVTGTVDDYFYTAIKVLDATSRLPIKDVVSVSAGYDHALALTASGNVYAWGDNSSAQLGNGLQSLGTVRTLQPDFVQMPAGQIGKLSNIKSISTGWYHSLALTNDGRVLSWGMPNSYSSVLGSGLSRAERKFLPGYVVDISGTTQLANVLSISANRSASYALTSTGEVVSWGTNYSGSLGIGIPVATLFESFTPRTVLNSTGTAPLNVGDLTQFKNLSARYR
jgi:alpha-tubulin suppressor-like RCC1 family protein